MDTLGIKFLTPFFSLQEMRWDRSWIAGLNMHNDIIAL